MTYWPQSPQPKDMGRSYRSPLTNASDLYCDSNSNMSLYPSSNCQHKGLHCECQGKVAGMSDCSSTPTISAGSPQRHSQRPSQDPEGTRQEDFEQGPGSIQEKDTDKKSKKKGRKRKKKEKNSAEEDNVCASTVADECQNTCQNIRNKNCPQVRAADASCPERKEQMKEDDPSPEGSGEQTMAGGKKEKKRRKKLKGSSEGHGDGGGHEVGSCLEGSDLTQGNITTHHEDHESSCETSTSQGSAINGSTGPHNEMHAETAEQKRIRTKLEANAAGLEELHLLKQSQLAKVQEALAMVKQRCRPELTSSHMSPPISPSRLGLKSFFNWSFDVSNGSSSSLYNEPISEADEDKMRPRAATFSTIRRQSNEGHSETVSPDSSIQSPSVNYTPVKKQFTRPRSLNGTQLSYNFPSPMHAVLLQYESLSAIDGKQEEKVELGVENVESPKHHSIVKRREIHGVDHKMMSKSNDSKEKKSAKRASDSGLLDMRHILRELSQQELNSPVIDIKDVDYPFKRLARSASMGAYDKKCERPKFSRSSSFRKARSQSRPSRKNANQGKENDFAPVDRPKDPSNTNFVEQKTSNQADIDDPFQTRFRSFSVSEGSSSALKQTGLLRENSVSCSDIDKSPDPNKCSLPPKLKCADSSDENIGRNQDDNNEVEVIVKPAKSREVDYHFPVSDFTSMSNIHSGSDSPKCKPKNKMLSVVTKLRSHGSLEHLFQRRWRNSLSKIDLNVDSEILPEWEYPKRHRSVQDLNPSRRYSIVVTDDNTVISMPERSEFTRENTRIDIIADSSGAIKPEKYPISKTDTCDSSSSASQSSGQSLTRKDSGIRPNYLKLKKRQCTNVAQPAC